MNIELTKNEQISNFIIGEINKIKNSFAALQKLVSQGDANISAQEIREALGEDRFDAVLAFLSLKKEEAPSSPVVTLKKTR